MEETKPPLWVLVRWQPGLTQSALVQETVWTPLRPLAKAWHPVWWAVVEERQGVGGMRWSSAAVVVEGDPRLEADG